MVDNPALSLIAIVVIAALVLLFGIWWLWWRLPKWQVNRLSLKIRDPKARADVEDNFRKTVGQALGINGLMRTLCRGAEIKTYGKNLAP